MDIKLKVGSRIRELRESLKLSQEGLAFKADVDRTFINHVENGRRNLSIVNLEKIINALEITTQEFFHSEFFNGNKKIKVK
jgi:transcriptional regulator with XRE-family HTH domain